MTLRENMQGSHLRKPTPPETKNPLKSGLFFKARAGARAKGSQHSGIKQRDAVARHGLVGRQCDRQAQLQRPSFTRCQD